MWNVDVTFDAACRAVLSADKPLVYVCPPAGWALRPLFEQFPAGEGLETLILVPGPGDALDVATALHATTPRPVHAATGVERTGRLLRSDALGTLVATPATAHALLGRSALKLDAVTRTVWAWPERVGDAAQAAEEILAEARGAQRVIVTADDAETAEVIRRHARRAPVAVHSRPPERPLRTARYAVIGATTRSAAAAAVMETLDPVRTLIWNPLEPIADAPAFGVGPATGEAVPEDGLVLFADLPTTTLLERVPPETEAVVLVRPDQIAYLRRLVRVAGPVRISREPDRLHERTAALRRRLRATLETETLDAELQALEPLLDEFDPALIAAAALRDSLTSVGAAEAEVSTWTRMHLNAGRKDRVGPKDVVGALVNAVGLAPDRVGRIDVQERFTLVDVRPEDAPRIARSLTGQSLRGKRITARLDRR